MGVVVAEWLSDWCAEWLSGSVAASIPRAALLIHSNIITRRWRKFEGKATYRAGELL